MTMKEKQMKISQTHRAALIATHTNDAAPQKHKCGWLSALIAIAGFLVTAAFHTGAVAQTKSPQGVRNIVIVHGAWADGSSWSKVIPLLQAKGLHVVAVQNPLTSLADDVAATKRALALQDGPVLLVGHSYGGAVITEAGNDPKVVGLVYVAALVPQDGESVASVTKPFPPAPLGSEVRADAEGFLTVTAKGIAEDFAQDLPDREKQVLTATQAPTAAAVFEATITTAAWKTKPSWCVIASNDRVVSPELEKAEAAAMKATSITIPSSHVPMLSHPKQVANFIEQAAANAESRIQPSQQSSQRIAGGSSEDLKKWRSLQAHP
jgi:pimeloyl-ACP methyl ester carboxylesterase